MSFFGRLARIFQNLFSGVKPENRIKFELKKNEAALRALQPGLYKAGRVLPNVGEAFRVLAIHTKPVYDILSATITGPDIPRNGYFSDLLLATGYTAEEQELLASLSFAQRKEEIRASLNQVKTFDEQKKRLEKLLKALSSPVFQQIDIVLCRLIQFSDICQFNYLTALHLFDPDYSPGLHTGTANFQEIPLETLENVFMDFYYLTGRFELTASIGRAVLTLGEQQHTLSSEEEKEEILGHLRKISAVLKKVLSPAILVQFLSLIRNDPQVEPQTAVYEKTAITGFIDRKRKQFEADQQRIKTEVQDETISAEVARMFGSRPLAVLAGYNQETNAFLQSNTSLSFMWITPLLILKTFLTDFFGEPLQTLFNTLVVEGFFNNPVHKSEFSATVYYCTESRNRILAFENSFSKGEPNDTALITGYVRDSHKNTEFLKNLNQMVQTINMEAQQLIQSEITQLYDLYLKTEIIITDARKPNADFISNIKLLFSSARNRDNAEILEKQHPYWNIFLEIMKNYAIIGDIEKTTT